jgi:hypothetical protein
MAVMIAHSRMRTITGAHDATRQRRARGAGRSVVGVWVTGEARVFTFADAKIWDAL